MPVPPEEPVVDPREQYRSSLEDTILLLKKLGPTCGDLEELIGVLELATKNDSQLQLILQMVAPTRLRNK